MLFIFYDKSELLWLIRFRPVISCSTSVSTQSQRVSINPVRYSKRQSSSLPLPGCWSSSSLTAAGCVWKCKPWVWVGPRVLPWVVLRVWVGPWVGPRVLPWVGVWAENCDDLEIIWSITRSVTRWWYVTFCFLQSLSLTQTSTDSQTWSSVNSPPHTITHMTMKGQHGAPPNLTTKPF